MNTQKNGIILDKPTFPKEKKESYPQKPGEDDPVRECFPRR